MPINKLVDRPVYNEGDKVIAKLGEAEYRGVIRGVGIQGAIDLWVIEVAAEDRDLLPEKYPYSNIMVPHPLIRPLDTGK